MKEKQPSSGVELVGKPLNEVWTIIDEMRTTEQFGESSNFHRIGIVALPTEDPKKRLITINVGTKTELTAEEIVKLPSNTDQENKTGVPIVYEYNPIRRK